MEKIYFAGKFQLDSNKTLPLEKRLVNDFRSKILGGSEKLKNAVSGGLLLNNGYIYSGPFYCEKASNGDFTSDDCNTVLNEEYKAVEEADIYFALFDQKFSVGTIVELGWAIEMGKKIVMFYEEEKNSTHDIKSEYWFAIANALKNSNKIRVYKFNNIDDVVNKINEGEIFNEI